MTDQCKKKNGITGFFNRLFWGRSNSTPNLEDVGKSDKKTKKSLRKKDKNSTENSSISEDFGIEATERLSHFQKPKPPSRRRPPRGLPQSIAPAEPIPEKDESKEENPTTENVKASKTAETNENETKDQIKEMPKLYTPALPPPNLRSLLLAKSGSDRHTIDCFVSSNNKNENDENLKSEPAIVHQEVELTIDGEEDETEALSIKSLTRSLSSKIDFDQIRSKSKNLRLVKSLEVSQNSENAKIGVRSSDPGPGRQ